MLPLRSKHASEASSWRKQLVMLYKEPVVKEVEKYFDKWCKNNEDYMAWHKNERAH